MGLDEVSLDFAQLVVRPEDCLVGVEVDLHRLPDEGLDVLQVEGEAVHVVLQHGQNFAMVSLLEAGAEVEFASNEYAYNEYLLYQ